MTVFNSKSSNESAFRMSDLMANVPALVDDDVKVEQLSEDEETALVPSSQFVTQYVSVKNRVVYDMHPKSADIYQSGWPHFWLREIESGFKLQRAEAAKNQHFAQIKIGLLNDALKVSLLINVKNG